MRLYSFTPTGGSEYVIPDQRYELAMPAQFRTAPVILPAASGAWDAFGTISPRSMDPMSLKFCIYAASHSALDTAIQACRLAFNRRGTLKALMGDASYRQTSFRAEQLELPTTYEHPLLVMAQVRGQAEPYWKSVTLNSQSGASPLTITNAGDADAYNGLQLVLTASGSCTAISISNAANGYSFTWSNPGTPLTVGQTITINPVSGTVVRSTGADELPYVTFGSSQIALFKLAPGANVLTYSATAGGGSLAVSWRDTWH